MKRFITAVILIMSVVLASQADLSYMPVSEGAPPSAATYKSLFPVVGDASPGTAGIESHAWSDGTYWHYSYKIINNDATATPGINNFGFTKCDPTRRKGYTASP